MAYRRWGVVALGVAVASCAKGSVTDFGDDDDGSSGVGPSTGSGTGGMVEGLCGNGQIDGGETCDTDCPLSCDDGDECTTDTLEGATHTCNVVCENTPLDTCSMSADGCCPTTCHGNNDPDCAQCGNSILELGEICDGNCPASCDDAQVCTTDSQMGSATTCDLECEHVDVTQCVAGDICCPAGCNMTTDGDCGGNDLILVHGSAYITDVQTKLAATGVFPIITVVNAGAVTPALAQLQMHDVALVFSDNPFLDPVALGNNLADFYDGGGRVVVATFARCGGYAVQGRFGNPAEGYTFFAEGSILYQSGSLGTVLEPASPLMTGVSIFTATTAYQCVNTIVNGGVTVAQWTGGNPLIVRGVAHGRNRVDLNFYPPSNDGIPGGWTGDGTVILRNALIYQ